MCHRTHVLLVIASVGLVCAGGGGTGSVAASPTASSNSIDWKHWITKLSEFAVSVPLKDNPGAADDPKQLSTLWNVINFARYVLCECCVGSCKLFANFENFSRSVSATMPLPGRGISVRARYELLDAGQATGRPVQRWRDVELLRAAQCSGVAGRHSP